MHWIASLLEDRIPGEGSTAESTAPANQEFSWNGEIPHIDAEGLEIEKHDFDPVARAMDTADNHHLKYFFERAVEELENDLGIHLGFPEPTVERREKVRLTAEVEFGDDWKPLLKSSSFITSLEPSRLKELYYQHAFRFLGEELEDMTAANRRDMKQRHRMYEFPENLDMRIQDVENGIGSYENSEERIKIDPQNFLDLEHGINMKREADETVEHELAHAVHYAVNHVVPRLSRHVWSNTENHSDYSKDIRRASIEDITEFEENLKRAEDNQQALRDPLELPGKLAARMDFNEDSPLYNDPYVLGQTEAEIVDLALREEHGDGQGRELAREYLVSTATTPTGVEGGIENAIEMLGFPNYHEEVERHRQMLVSRDPEKGAEKEADILIPRLRQIDPLEPGNSGLEDFYSAHALITAYEQVEGENLPEKVRQLDQEMDILLQKRYTGR